MKSYDMTKAGRWGVMALFTFHLSLFTSCSLDEQPRDQIPEEEAYQDADDLFRNCVATLYNYIGGNSDGQGLQGTCRGVYDLQTLGGDELMIPTRGTDWYDGGLWQAMYRHSWSAGHDLMKNAWLYLYKVIALSNRSLEQLEAHRHLLSSDEWQRYTAEVRALRAIYYWYLTDLFGRVPLVTSTDVSMNEVRQSERSEVFRFIVGELLDVMPWLSYESSVHDGDYYGRVTRPVATFAMAKLMLNAEVYADDDWTDGVRPDGRNLRFDIDGLERNAWEACIYYCDAIEAMGYQLEEAYEDNFVVYNQDSRENIWTIPMDKILYSNQQQTLTRSMHYRQAAAFGYTGENGTCATRKTLETYGYGAPDYDLRFIMNFYYEEIYDLEGNPILDRTGQTLTYAPWEVEMDLSGSPYVETAGARLRKYEVDKNALKDGKLMDNDIVLFRFADVLLMRAEARLRNGEDGQADLDAVRLRVGETMRPLTLGNLLDERLMELCFEGWRRQDLIRFGQYESLFQGDEWYDKVDERDGHTTVYPIPADIMALNTMLEQSPGY
ncbi:MAG: RagB/SusD family nutrient uptake outer membrane protein [Bacteroidaceae bacterium]|nr:RagB/SusD family nutrient uptake outer membrane protein [Bacteroidaceae bacterium]